MDTPFRGDAQVDWAQAREANRLNWSDRVPLHEESYGLGDFDDPAHISSVVEDDLPVLSEHLGRGDGRLDGLDLLHLQCHIGTDTVSLARRGARVSGLDFSADALAAAQRFATGVGEQITWYEGDVLDARAVVEGDFDVVYTSIGTICWLSDLHRWARQIAALLRPGGVFYIRDGHPAMLALDETQARPVIRYRYFGDGRAQHWDDEGTYAGAGTVEHSETFEWPHPISEIIGAVLEAGLVLDRFDEGRTLPWRFAPRMSEVAPGRFAFPEEERDLVPTTFTLVARRPA